jgi:hypothetical protein
MLETLSNKGATIEEATDGETNFFVVAGRACPFVRSKEWLFENEIPDDQEAMVRAIYDYVKLRCHAIVITTPDTTFFDLDDIVANLEKQTPIPTRLSVINYSMLRPSVVRSVVESFPKGWNIVQNSDEDFTLDNIYTAINNAVKQFREVYYFATFMCGQPIPEDYFATLHQLLYRDMERFNCLTPPLDAENSLHGVFISTAVFVRLGGYKTDDEGHDFFFRLSKIEQQQLEQGIIKCKLMKPLTDVIILPSSV